MKRYLLIILLLAAVSCTDKVSFSVLDASLTLDTPVVVDGGDLSFTLHSNHSSFLVRKFSCEFSGTGVIEAGQTYQTDANGNISFTIPAVSITDDHNAVMTLVIYDEDSKSEKTFTSIISCRVFSLTMSVLTPVVFRGDSLELLLIANRRSLRLDKVSCDVALSLSVPQTLTLTDDAVTLYALAGAGKETGYVPVTLTLYDDMLALTKSVTDTFYYDTTSFATPKVLR